MEVSIHSPDSTLSSDDLQAIRQRVAVALARVASAVRRVRVSIGEVARPHADDEITLRLAVYLKAGPRVVLTESDREIQAAASRGAERLRRGVVRRLRDLEDAKPHSQARSYDHRR